MSKDEKVLRQDIPVGRRPDQVTPVAYWYQNDFFTSDEEARGAFRLAYEQATDGMGCSVAEWMGLTEEELEAWKRSEQLPNGDRWCV